MSKTRKRQSMLDKQLLAAFRESGMTRYELSKRSGAPYAAIHGWVAGTRSLTLATASKVCKVLGLELGPKRKR